jgi:hypothetical protein
MKISISFYRIFFRPPGSKEEDRQYIGELTGDNPEAMKSLESFFKDLPAFAERTNIISGKHVSSVYHDKSKFTITDEQISGILQVGEDGFSSEIHNGQSGDHLLSRTPEDMEFIPFYYLLDGKLGCKDVILGIQHFGGHGIATKFIPLIQSYLRKAYPNYIVKLDAIHLGPIFFDKIISEGSVKNIEAVSFSDSSDRATINEDKIKVTMSYGVCKKGGVMSQSVTDLIRRNGAVTLGSEDNTPENLFHKVSSLLSINLPEGLKVAELSATMSFNGTTRKIDLGNIDKFATRYDVTDIIEKGGNKHPIFSSIDKEAKDILEKDIRGLIK